MKLKNLKDYISSFPNGTVFKYGISKPFSWRGSYDEVAFSIDETSMTREDILKNVELAYTNLFTGYKGGGFRYDECTTVNFEDGHRDYSSGRYVTQLIAKIEETPEYISQEDRLVKLAFKPI